MNKLKAFLTVSASFMLLSVLGCASTKPYVEPPLPVSDKDTKVPGGSLTEKLAWLETNADSRNLYIVEVNANENIAPRTLEYSGATDITIVLRGVGENRTLRLASHGTMFRVKPNVTLILDNNITLQGHSQNTGPMVDVDGGDFVMRTGSYIIDNDRGSGDGGGVYVRSGNFKMVGLCAIVRNSADNGGGVFVSRGVFEMHCGAIANNIANKRGGGVYSSSYKADRYSDGSRKIVSNFTMGVEGKDAFTNNNGCAMIVDNIARVEGGGVYITYDGGFFYHGIVAGYYTNGRGNVVKDEGGNVLSGKGNAFSLSGPCYTYYYIDNMRKSTEIPCGNEAGMGKMDKGWIDMSNAKTDASATAAPTPELPAAIAPEIPAAAAPVQEQIVEQEQPVEQEQIREQVVVQQVQTAPNIDPRLVGGSWWNGNKGGCTKWTFGDNGKGSVEYHCDITPFDFTAVNGRITFFGKVQVCNEEGCEEVEMPGRNFSFTDDGKTLIIDRDKFTKGGPASCCPH